jgi:RimJ/RimL family protein N-acetyltransferase
MRDGWPQSVKTSLCGHMRGTRSTSSWRALRDGLFINREVMRIGAPVMHANPDSARVAEKIGMRLEGVAPSIYVKSDVRYDQLNFGITREQWLELRSIDATA